MISRISSVICIAGMSRPWARWRMAALISMGSSRRSVSIQKIPEHLVPVLAENGFGVELHPLHCERPVTQTHDFVPLAGLVFCPGRHFQAVRQRSGINHQRVVAGGGKRGRQAGKDALALMMNRRQLAMHDLLRPDDVAAEGLANTLVPQTDSQQRDAPGELLDDFHRDTGLVGRTGTR